MATELKHTIASSGGDFSSLSAAWDHLEASHSNLVTADVYALLEIQDSFEDTTACTFHNVTTDSTRYVEVYTLAAARHAGEWDESKYHLYVTNNYAIYVSNKNIRCIGFQIFAEENRNIYSGSKCIGSSWDYFGGITLDRMIFRNQGTAAGDSSFGVYMANAMQGSDAHLRIQNCVFYVNTAAHSRTGAYFYGHASYPGDAHIYNCTFKNFTDGIRNLGNASYVVRVKNCGFISCTNDLGGTITDATTNSASTPTLKSGTSFHLDTSDTTWKNQGTDLSSDGGIINSLDIDDDTRSGTWDIGADEYTAGGATYNESVTFSSGPAISNSVLADLLGSIGLASTPAFTPAAIADFFDEITVSSNPAVIAACVLDIFPSLALLSNPAMGVSAIVDFLAALTLASTPATVMAAVADLFTSLALASDPAFAAVGGSDFYNSVEFLSDPAFSSTAFKDAFGELSLLSSPALAASALADLYAAITLASACGISLTALADLFATMSLSSNPAIAAAGQIGGTVIQKMVMESIGVREISLRSEVEKLTGDIDIVNRILSNPYDEIVPVSTTWERTEKRQKDE